MKSWRPQSALAKAALALAAKGWPVFPCSPNNKRPLVGESSPGADDAGLYRATTDRATIEGWWKDWPDAMIGVPTGAPIGAFVLDIDPKDGATVDQVLADIEAVIGEPLPEAPMVQTPRGGRHIYIAMPEGVEIGNRAKVIPGDVDVRGTGGYVIVPPSIRKGAKARQEGCDGKGYSRFRKGTPPAPSEALIRFVTEYRHDKKGQAKAAPTKAPAKRQPRESKPAAGQQDAVTKYALSALHAEVEAVAAMSQGGRNDRLNRAAYALGQLVGAGVLEEHDVEDALEAAADRCGLVREDGIRSVRATIASGLRGGIAQPRDLSDIGARPATPRERAADGSQAEPARGRSSGSGHGGGAGGNGRNSAAAGDGDGPDPAILQACAREPQNDTGNGRRLRHHFGQDMLHVREVGDHYWCGTHWEAQGASEAFVRFAQVTAEAIALEAMHMYPTPAERKAMGDAEPISARSPDELNDGEKELLRAARVAMEQVSKRREARRKFAISSGNTSRINGMLAQALPHLTVAPQEMDADPLAINVLNGTLRLVQDTMEVWEPIDVNADPSKGHYVKRKFWKVQLDPHRREDRISKVMPVEYNEQADCPRWIEFMQKFQPKQSVRNFLRMFHGYALTALMGEQVFVYNYGLGANGKSTFMEAIARLMGPYAQVLPAEAITGDMQRRGDQATPEFARLPGARMVRCAELPRGQGFKEHILKLLTGGEPILVRHLHARFFEFLPTFKAIGSGNDKPPIGGVDEGIWRRMKLVPWEVTIPSNERRPMAKVLAEFEAEGPGILNWLLTGLIDYLENGWWVPPEVQGATDSYRADMDPVGEFCAACVVSLPGQNVTAREMYHAYVAWAHANSVKPFAEKTFAQIMTQKGYEKTMGRIRTYHHVKLEGVPDDPDLVPPPYSSSQSRF